GSEEIEPYSLAMSVPQVHREADLSKINWEVVDVQPAQGPHNAATFRMRVGDLEVTRRYALAACERKGTALDEAPAYLLEVELSFRTLGARPQTVSYELQGPTGVPLENADNTQKFRDVVAGFVSGPGASKNELMTAKAIAENKGEKWTTPFDYIGVDCQYF